MKQISDELYTKILNLCTLPYVCNTDIDLYDEDSDSTLNLKEIIEDIRESL